MDQLSIFSVAKGSLGKFVDIIAKQGGMSYSNNFDVQFDFSRTDGLRKHMSNMGVNFSQFGKGQAPSNDEEMNSVDAASVLKVFCEEAQLPNVQAATGTHSGRRLGEGSVNYAHTRLYTDFQLGWMCDANMTPLKFLNAWYTYIFGDYNANGTAIFGQAGSTVAPGSATAFNTTGAKMDTMKGKATTGELAEADKEVRLQFPDEYQCNVVITKSEKGKSAPNGRPSMMYTMVDCFPYAIDAVPLSYGASQVTKVTANFYYRRYNILYNDIRNMAG